MSIQSTNCIGIVTHSTNDKDVVTMDDDTKMFSPSNPQGNFFPTIPRISIHPLLPSLLLHTSNPLSHLMRVNDGVTKERGKVDKRVVTKEEGVPPPVTPSQAVMHQLVITLSDRESLMRVEVVDIPLTFLAFSMLMFLPSSRFQVTTGLGLPRAAHSRVTLEPSVRTLSPLLRLSTMRGGTENVHSLYRVFQRCGSW